MIHAWASLFLNHSPQISLDSRRLSFFISSTGGEISLCETYIIISHSGALVVFSSSPFIASSLPTSFPSLWFTANPLFFRPQGVEDGSVDPGPAAPGRCSAPDAVSLWSALPHRGAALSVPVDRGPAVVSCSSVQTERARLHSYASVCPNKYLCCLFARDSVFGVFGPFLSSSTSVCSFRHIRVTNCVHAFIHVCLACVCLLGMS